MNAKKWLSLFMVMMMIAASFAVIGCADEEVSDDPDTNGEDPIDDPNGDDEVTLSYYTWWADAEQAMGEALVEQFEDEHPNVKVDASYIDVDHYLSNLNTLVAADNEPDVYYLNEYLVHDWGNAGVSADLAPIFDEIGIDAHDLWVESALYQSDDAIYGINYGSTTIVLYYNRDMLAEAGIEEPGTDATDPWTWDEFASAAVKMTQDVNGNTPEDDAFDIDSTTVFGTTMPTAWIYWNPVLYAAGTSIASDDGTDLLVTQPQATDALQEIANLHHVHKAAPSVGVTDSVFSDESSMLMNDQLGMFIGGTFLLGNFTGEDYDVGISQIPVFEGATPSNMVWSAAFSMSDNSDHPQEAARFLAHMADFDNSVNACMADSSLSLGSLPSTHLTLDEDTQEYANWNEVYNPTMAEVTAGILADASRAGENTTLKNFSVLMDELLVPTLDEVWLGDKTAAEAIGGIEDDLLDNLEGTW